MTKADLRTGMVVTLRDGGKYLVVTEYQGGMFVGLVNGSSYMPFQKYKDDLTHYSPLFGHDEDFDVMSIEKVTREIDIRLVFTDIDEVKLEPVWTREPEEFKVVCVNTNDNYGYTRGKIYEIKNGTLIDDFGTEIFAKKINSIEYLNAHSVSEWLQVVE